MSKRRSRERIIAEILDIAKSGTKKSHIVFRANLNFNIIRDYLRDLTRAGMIEKIEGSWKTTEKGLEYVSLYRNLTILEAGI